MRLLNFCIGHVQTIDIGGEAVKTAHVKAPVAEPWIITPNGATGDQRASHPDKIYAFAWTGYDYWGDHFGLDPDQWPDGFFGENLTLDMLDETDVRVGDVFEIGDEVRLVVTGARTPCVKLAWRLNQPRTFQKVFAQSRHTGVYLDVLSGGRVRPGATLCRTQHDTSMPSIADVCAIIASRKPPIEALRRLLAFDHLSHTNRFILSAKVQDAERAALLGEGSWAGWRPFVVERIVEEAPGIRSLHVRPADGLSLHAPKSGQYVSVKMAGDDGQRIVRTWSLSSFAEDPAFYRLTVKRQAGRGSDWIHRAILGAELQLRSPAGDFTLNVGGFQPVVLIAAGIGVTPLLAMLQAHLHRGKDGPPIYLIYAAKTPEEMAFRLELNALGVAHPNLHVTFVFSRSEEGSRPRGRITIELVKEVLTGLYVVVGGAKHVIPWYEGEMYICGPEGFAETLRSELIDGGVNPDCVFTELFSAPVQPDRGDVEAAEVRFHRSGVSATWHRDDDLSLLDLAENAGVPVENECRAGVCLTCKTMILSGEATLIAEDGSTLMCVARPKTGVLVLDC